VKSVTKVILVIRLLGKVVEAGSLRAVDESADRPVIHPGGQKVTCGFGTCLAACAVAWQAAACPLAAQDPVVQVGSGSYAAVLPPGAKGPPAEIFATERVRAKMPTSDWWSSLAWMPHSDRHYPHPLAMEAGGRGLRIFYPGANITARHDAIYGFMPAATGDDLILGHSAEAEFLDARVDGWSDWFVAVRFAARERQMRVCYGHGSPFVYATFEQGSARLAFSVPPTVWAGDENAAVLGLTIGGKHYGLFGPSSSTWSGLGSAVLTNITAKDYFSLAVLPDNRPETLALFRRYAYCHVVDTSVAWQYEPETAAVTTTFSWTTRACEGEDAGTLFALYPHQWRHTDSPLLDLGYASVRGQMRLSVGRSFRTNVPFHGVLPALPVGDQSDARRMREYLAEELAVAEPPVRDTYWEGKWLGRLAAVAPIAEQYGETQVAARLRSRIQRRLEGWFTAADASGLLKDRGLFSYDDRWGTLIGYPASYGSDTELNDHHFHYGYFLRAAAEIARRDPAWAADDRWGGMVGRLIRDIASDDRGDPAFPFLRCFDPYAGHSWASGHARFGDGNNQESSSEAMNAWYGLILWGEATGSRRLRDLGIWLYTTEMTAIQEYWFDIHGENFPPSYAPSTVAMVWGGKASYGTWFSAHPEAIHGINWLPFHGGSLYLGHDPAYVAKNYAALAHEKGDTHWREWPDIIWMYRALDDPADAQAQFEGAGRAAALEAGNSRANAYHWLAALSDFGQVDRTVVADAPLYAVFRRGRTRTYAAYNGAAEPRAVNYSDGYRLLVPAGQFALGRRAD
jgi:endoglucanase Acf2